MKWKKTTRIISEAIKATIDYFLWSYGKEFTLKYILSNPESKYYSLYLYYYLKVNPILTRKGKS